MATALPGHGTLWKVANDVEVPPGGTITDRPGFWLQVVVSAETVPSSPLPPDMCSETNEASGQSPGQAKVWSEDEKLV